MVISVECLIAQTNACLTTASGMLPVAQLVGVHENVATVPYSVACLALLPDATCNMGRFVYVTDIGSYRFSDGTSWTRDFDGSGPLVNLLSWGLDTSGQLGNGLPCANQCTPVTPTGGYDQSWCTVSAGLAHTAAIKTDGTAWTWGNNAQGSLGDGTTVNRASPGAVTGGGTNWVSTSAGTNATAAIKTDGTLWTWGRNVYGYLGDLTVVNRSSPGTVSGGGTTWCQISVCNHTAAVKTDGTAWTWGFNNCGQLGDGTVVDRSSPGTLSGGGTTWCQIDTGIITAAVKTDGTLWTWGSNLFGTLGDGTVMSRSSPGTTAGGGTTWCAVSAGSSHTAAVKTDGTVWTWGANALGRLGDGTVMSRSSPGTTAGGGTTWCTISAGGSHTAAIKTDGTAWTWGFNTAGALGDGTIITSSSPVTVAGGINTWCSISTGSQHTVGLTAPL